MLLDRILKSLYLGAVLAAVASCGSAPVKQQSLVAASAEQVEQMASYPQLLSLYSQTATSLQGKDPALYASDYALLAQIANRLVAVKQESLGKTFDDKRLSSGEVPLAVLQPLRDEARNAAPLSADKWQPVVDMIEKEWQTSDGAMKERVAQLEAGSLDDNTRLLLMDDLYRISGNQFWLDQRNAFVDSLVEEIRAAKRDGKLSADLQPKIALVREIRADDKGLIEELVEVSAAIYRQEYFNALGEGDADKAYQVFESMAKSKDFDSIKATLADSSQKMVDYFVALADESVKDPQNVARSYRWYSQARSVSNELGLKSKAAAGEKALVEQLHAVYEKLSAAEQPTIALAYLNYVQEFAPLYKGLRQEMSEEEEKVSALAIRRISTTGFDGASAEGYGDVISSNITQYMFEHIPNDVRIVERKQYEAIKREREMAKKTEGLSAVDLLITGSILDAKVDTTQVDGKKKLRVTVGTEKIPNPGYISWLEMSGKERNKVEKPSETLTVDKQENVEVNITKHRKVGVFSVSYRLVDAANSRVIFPDSISKEAEFIDDSSEGVQMGDFELPFKMADLPSDVKILDTLAREVSTEIGQSLVDKLKDQDKHYLAKADEFAKDKSCIQEADSLAKALVIMKAKGLDSDAVLARYKALTIGCGAVL